MNAPDNHPELEQRALEQRDLKRRARELYTRATARLDPPTVNRLRSARRHALQAAQAPARTARMLLPAGAFAVIALAVTMLWLPQQQGAAIVAAPHATAASPEADRYLPPDADSADPKLYQNLDFYGWLASNNDHAGESTAPQ